MRKNELIYKSKYGTLPGTSLPEVMQAARLVYHDYEKKTRRKTYVKTKNKSYLGGAKVFLDNYFPHLAQKSIKDRYRRVQFFVAGLDLIQNNPHAPISQTSNSRETFMRFVGATRDGKRFFVQIRKNKNGNHYLISTFPDTNAK